MNKKVNELEALLFHYGEPIATKKVSSILKVSEQELRKISEEYTAKLAESGGLTLLIHSNTIQLSTKTELDYITKKLMDDEFSQELTPATLEVLTIVAYLGPISRANIDFIRGVNSSFTLRNLAIRGLVDKEKEGRTYNYRVSNQFLHHMGLNRVENLPDYDKYKNVLAEYELKSETN